MTDPVQKFSESAVRPNIGVLHSLMERLSVRPATSSTATTATEPDAAPATTPATTLAAAAATTATEPDAAPAATPAAAAATTPARAACAADSLMCGCGRGICFEAVRALGHARGTPRVRRHVEGVINLADEARRLIAEYSKVECSESTVERDLEKLKGSWKLLPGVIDAEILHKAASYVKKLKPDVQFERLGGQDTMLAPLRDLKDLRHTSIAKEYFRPDRIHFGMAHEGGCTKSSAWLDFYGKSWTKEPRALEMRQCARAETQPTPRPTRPPRLTLTSSALPPSAHSMGMPIFDLEQEAKRKMHGVMNEASREAVYNVCVAMISKFENDGCEGLNMHTDTKPTHKSDLPKMPYVEGAGILIASVGMSQLLYTQGITSTLYQKPEKLSSLQIPTVELTHGSAYYWEAGAEGSVDWMCKHGTWKHPDARPGETRIAFVFRAIKPEHMREYKQKYPYCMVDESRKRGADGRSMYERAGQPEVWA